MELNAQLAPHFLHPQHVGIIEGEEWVGRATVGSKQSGKIVQLHIRLNAQSIIEEVKFKAYGCGFTIAVIDWLATWLQGRSLAEAMTLNRTMIAHMLELPSSKLYSAALAEDALKTALRNTGENSK